MIECSDDNFGNLKRFTETMKKTEDDNRIRFNKIVTSINKLYKEEKGDLSLHSNSDGSEVSRCVSVAGKSHKS